MKLIILSLLLSIPLVSKSQLVKFESWMYDAVVKIEVLSPGTTNNGTAFFAKYRGEIFLITAKHLFAGHHAGDSVSIVLTKGNRKQTAKWPIYFDEAPNTSDVAVTYAHLPPATSIGINLDSNDSTGIGEPILYLGFPSVNVINNLIHVNSVAMNGEILPLLKRGYVSGFNHTSMFNNTIIFDTHSTPGFSGSPIFVTNSKTKQPEVFAVLSGGLNANLSATDGVNQIQLKDLFYQTSISYGSAIGHAKSIIDVIFFRK